MEYADVPRAPDAGCPRASDRPGPLKEAQRAAAEAFVKRCSQARLEALAITFSYRHATVSVPGVLVGFAALSVVFGLDSPRKWRVALEEGWVPEALLDWVGVRGLEELAAQAEVGWVPPRRFVDALSERVGQVLIEVAQPRAGAQVRQTIRRVLLHKGCVCDGGLVIGGRYWKRFLREGAKPLRAAIRGEVRERIAWALGRLEVAELAPRRWRPLPILTEEGRAILEAATVGPPPDRLVALQEAFDGGLFDFIADLLAAGYSVCGRRAYHPLLMWKVVVAMMAKRQMHAGTFLETVNDSNHLRLFLGVMSTAELPSARRIKGFLTDRLAPVAEHLVLWFNTKLVADGAVGMGDEFGTDGLEMGAQARTKSDAVRTHLGPAIAWLSEQLRAYLESQGRTELTDAERHELLDALRQLPWRTLGSAQRSKHAILGAVRAALGGEVVTPPPRGPPSGPGPPSPAFVALAAGLAAAFGERIKAFGPHFDWDTFYDPQCGARTKYGKTLHGYGLQFVVDLSYGLVWAFAVFPAGQKFQPRIADFILAFQDRHGLGDIKLTSDSEFTIAQALARWHRHGIDSYGPHAASPAARKGIFTEADFDVGPDHAVCPNGKVLHRKPKMVIRGSHHEWRYQARKRDCAACPLRAQCTTSKTAPRALGVNVYREDVARQRARMAADPEATRDLMARHKALTEGGVNNLKRHQRAARAHWKGLAMARLQFALAIVMANLLKWHKVRHGLLDDLRLKRARQENIA